VPCRRPGAEEIGSTTPGSKVAGIHHASIDEATYDSREDEKITGAAASPTAGY
jgi:hypothetical protein